MLPGGTGPVAGVAMEKAAGAAALAALADQDFVAASREHNRAERTRFAEAVSALGNHGLARAPSNRS